MHICSPLQTMRSQLLEDKISVREYEHHTLCKGEALKMSEQWNFKITPDSKLVMGNHMNTRLEWTENT